MIKMKTPIATCIFLVIALGSLAQPPGDISLSNDHIRLVWHQAADGWKVTGLSVKGGQKWLSAEHPSGENTLLYAAEKPDTTPDTTFKTITGVTFPEASYKYQQTQWAESTNPVSLNTAGKAYHFFPKSANQISTNKIRFEQNTDVGTVTTEWSFDPTFKEDILVTQTLTVKQPGYFSLATPTLASVSEKNLAW